MKYNDYNAFATIFKSNGDGWLNDVTSETVANTVMKVWDTSEERGGYFQIWSSRGTQRRPDWGNHHLHIKKTTTTTSSNNNIDNNNSGSSSICSQFSYWKSYSLQNFNSDVNEFTYLSLCWICDYPSVICFVK